MDRFGFTSIFGVFAKSGGTVWIDEDHLANSHVDAWVTSESVWSADIGRVHRVVRQLKAGTVWVNTFGPTDVRLPWGGSGDSGFGREHGDIALQNFTEPKAVWINTG